MSERRWYLINNGPSVQGPYSLEEIQAIAREGRLHPMTQVSASAQGPFAPIYQVFQGALQPKAYVADYDPTLPERIALAEYYTREARKEEPHRRLRVSVGISLAGITALLLTVVVQMFFNTGWGTSVLLAPASFIVIFLLIQLVAWIMD